jgi:cellulose synthase/poly-beta-1,6-N-acetylglucosamine synthase-like glycosyltransferase
VIDISVIIAHDARRDPAELNRCLASVNYELDKLSLDDVSSEIIVESNGSTSEARNKAAAEAQEVFLVFVDDDAELRPGSLSELMEPFLDPDVGAVGGVNVLFPGADFREQLAASLLASPFLMLKSASRYTPRGGLRESDESELLTAFLAVRTEAFHSAGGFPVDVIPCEENVLINRIQQLSWKVMYNPFAVIYHKRPRLFWPYAKTLYHYGFGRGLMMRKLGSNGRSRVFWRPNSKWPFYFLGAIIHVCSYSLGLVVGYSRNAIHKIDKSKLEKKP